MLRMPTPRAPTLGGGLAGGFFAGGFFAGGRRGRLQPEPRVLYRSLRSPRRSMYRASANARADAGALPPPLLRNRSPQPVVVPAGPGDGAMASRPCCIPRCDVLRCAVRFAVCCAVVYECTLRKGGPVPPNGPPHRDLTDPTTLLLWLTKTLRRRRTPSTL
jgi:hypothetical protein